MTCRKGKQAVVVPRGAEETVMSKRAVVLKFVQTAVFSRNENEES